MEEYTHNIDSVLLKPLLIFVSVVTTVGFITQIAMNPLAGIYSAFIIIAFLLGASLASFIAAMVERIPKGEATNTPSHCACGRNLKVWENVPVLGWLTLKITNKGKTRCCNTTLPSWYFLLEAIAGFSFAGVVVFTVVNYVENGIFNPWVLVTVLFSVLTIIFLASDYRSSIPNAETDVIS